jgi:hypothetical protein
VDQGNFGEESRQRGGAIGCAKACTSSDERIGVLWTNTGARCEAELAGHRAGHDEPTRMNSGEAKLAKIRRE